MNLFTSLMAAFIILGPIIILIFVSFIGVIVLSLSMSKTSRKYRILVRELKQQSLYETWVQQHAKLVKVKKVLQYGSAVFVLALLLYISIALEFVSSSMTVQIVTAILVYAFWPFSFASMLIISRLYRTVPELWISDSDKS